MAVLSLTAEQEVFSAVIDGSMETNCAAKRFQTLEDAIDAALASEAPKLDIVVRPGEYKATSTVELDVTGLDILIHGEGGDARLLPPAAGETLFSFNGRAGKVTLKNVKLQGNVQFGDAETMDCQWLVESCKVEGKGDHCIIAGGHSGSTLTVRSSSLVNDGFRKDGIHFWEPKGRLVVESCTIVGCNVGIMTGFYENYGANDANSMGEGMKTEIKGNQISECLVGARFFPGVTGTMADNYIWNCKEALDLVTESTSKGKKVLPGFKVAGPEFGSAPPAGTPAGANEPARPTLLSATAMHLMDEAAIKVAEDKYASVEAEKERLLGEVKRLERQLDLAFALDKNAWDNKLRTMPPEALEGIRTRLLALYDRATQTAIRTGAIGGYNSNAGSACASPRSYCPSRINVINDGSVAGGPAGNGMTRVPSSELIVPRERRRSFDAGERRGSYDATSNAFVGGSITPTSSVHSSK